MIFKHLTLFSLVSVMLLGCTCNTNLSEITVTCDEVGSQIDLMVDGNLFTSFRYTTDYEKPFLYPIYSPDGQMITRGFPIDPRPGERTDHPHHIGMWFNHGNVNGLDFWNNSSAIQDKTNYGHIVVTKILEAKGGKRAHLKVLSEWRDQAEVVLLEETTDYYITATVDSRTIDRLSTLKAIQDVTITDNKEGLIAVRVDKAFEKPSNETQVFTDEHGNTTVVEVQDSSGANGMYYSSSGKTGDDIWGTRNDWVMLSAEKDGNVISFGFFDHPSNVGYPFHSHARGYGLFACNNLGAKVFNPGEEEILVTLAKGESLTLKHRFYLETGSKVPTERADSIFTAFSGKY